MGGLERRVQLSRQLGHADAAVTARYYARWIEHEAYRVPIQLRPGEVPADLLARLDGEGVLALGGVEIAKTHELVPRRRRNRRRGRHGSSCAE